MIVKNACALLPETLDALLPLWENHFFGQAVFVDTGSEDGTLAYLHQRFRDMPQVQICALDWPEDFSKARNVALEQVKTPWVFWLDADESLTPASATALLNWQDNLQRLSPEQWPEAVVCIRHNLDAQGRSTGQDYLTRLWQSSPAIRYVGLIHERPVRFLTPDQARPLQGVTHLEVHLQHRATAPEELALKQSLYGDYLNRARSESPSPYLDYHWVISPQVQRAYAPAERLAILGPAIQATQRQSAEPTTVLPFPAWAGVPWAAALLEAQYLWAETGQSQAMIDFFTTYLATEHPPPLFAESWGQLALAYVAQYPDQPQQWESATALLYRALEPAGAVFDPSQGWNTWRPHGILAQLYLQAGDYAAAWCHSHLALSDVGLSAQGLQSMQALQRHLHTACTFKQAVEQLQRAWQRAVEAKDEVATAWLVCFLWGLQGRNAVIEKLTQVKWESISDAHSLRYFEGYLKVCYP